jgi:zona occludens toxin
MALTLYVGPPGSGKSYEAVSSIMLPAYRAGRTIVTNIKGVRPDYWAENIKPDKGCSQGELTVVDEDFFNDEDNYPLMSKKGEVLGEGAIPAGALIVIDEAYLVFPSGPVHATGQIRDDKGGSGITKRMVEFIRTHRHFVSEEGIASDVVCISQDVESIHPRIRAVAEYATKIKNQRHLGLSKRYRVDVFSSPKCNRADKIGTSQRKYNLDIFKLYKSFEADGAAKVVMTDKSHRALKPYHVLFLIVALGLVIYAATRVSGAKHALSAAELTKNVGTRSSVASATSKPICSGSGVLVDLSSRRAFYNGQWRDIGESITVDGRIHWDAGPCLVRFG